MKIVHMYNKLYYKRSLEIYEYDKNIVKALEDDFNKINSSSSILLLSANSFSLSIVEGFPKYNFITIEPNIHSSEEYIQNKRINFIDNDITCIISYDKLCIILLFR